MSLLPMWRRRERHPVSSLQREMNSLFDDFFGGRSPLSRFWGDGDPSQFLPPMDMRETEDKVIIEAELPGLEPKDVDIHIEGRTLILSGERRQEKEEKKGSWHRVERSQGSFRRELELPHGADPEKVEAAFRNGILTVEVAKKEEARPRTIPVKCK